MSRQRNRLYQGKTRHVNASNPNEKIQLSEFVNGIKRYQDEEHRSMCADFERVEHLLSKDNEFNANKRSLLESRSLPGLQDRITENHSSQFVTQNGNTEVIHTHYRYVKWTLLLFSILFLGTMIQIYLGRFADNVFSILEYLQLQWKNFKKIFG